MLTTSQSVMQIPPTVHTALVRVVSSSSPGKLFTYTIDERRFAFSVPGDKDKPSLGNHHDRLVRQPWILEEQLSLPSFHLIFRLRWIGTSQSRGDYRWIRLRPGGRCRWTRLSLKVAQFGAPSHHSRRSRRLALYGIHLQGACRASGDSLSPTVLERRRMVLYFILMRLS